MAELTLDALIARISTVVQSTQVVTEEDREIASALTKWSEDGKKAIHEAQHLLLTGRRRAAELLLEEHNNKKPKRKVGRPRTNPRVPERRIARVVQSELLARGLANLKEPPALEAFIKQISKQLTQLQA